MITEMCHEPLAPNSQPQLPSAYTMSDMNALELAIMEMDAIQKLSTEQMQKIKNALYGREA